MRLVFKIANEIIRDFGVLNVRVASRLRHTLKRGKINGGDSRSENAYLEGVVGVVGDFKGGGSDFAIQAPPPFLKKRKNKILKFNMVW